MSCSLLTRGLLVSVCFAVHFDTTLLPIVHGVFVCTYSTWSPCLAGRFSRKSICSAKDICLIFHAVYRLGSLLKVAVTTKSSRDHMDGLPNFCNTSQRLSDLPPSTSTRASSFKSLFAPVQCVADLNVTYCKSLGV